MKGLKSSLGMWHQAGHIAAFVADAGDVQQGAVGICGVSQVSVRVTVLPKNLVVGFQLGERFLVGKVSACAVGEGDAQEFTCWNQVRER